MTDSARYADKPLIERTTNCREGSKAMKAKHYIGIVLIAIALTLANGANEPWLPMAAMALGMWLMRGIEYDESAED